MNRVFGVEWDIHVHSATDRVVAAQKIIALGGTPNTVASGVMASDIETMRSAQAGTGGYAWQADSLWGLVREGSRTLTAAEALATQMAQGGYTAPVYSATLMVDQLTLTVVDAASATPTSDGIDQIEAFAGRMGVLPHVRWARLSGTAAAWRAAGAVPSRIANTQ